MRRPELLVLGVIAGLALTACGTTSSPSTTPKPGSHRSHSAASNSPSAPAVPAPVVRAEVLTWRLPSPLSRSVVMQQGSHLLLAGGLQPGDHSTARVLAVDVAGGRTQPAGQLALPMHDSAGAFLGNRPVVVGGGGASELAQVQSTSGSSWQVIGQLPGGARSDLSVVPVSGALLVIGGYDGVNTPRSILRTTDGSHFQTIGHLPAGLRYAAVTVAPSGVWVFGGEVNHQELAEVLRIDPSTGRVTRMGRLPQPLGHAAVVSVGARFLLMGGRTDPATPTASMWWFDPSGSKHWSRAGRLPHPVADSPVAVIGGSAYLFGGETPNFSAAVIRVSGLS